uniref:G-protein coupled receptors family 3 profile domain-containing protein n=1 Tax=Panagrolaimus sp. JU765 TaxID=591449 RepID=A0AC34Q211_9BILA
MWILTIFVGILLSWTAAVRQVYLEGDIMIGGLFPIHEAGRNASQCGRIKADQGVQRMVAMLFTLEAINKNPHVLPGIKLGAQILDTCSVETHALEQSLEFIKSVMSTSDGLTCSDGSRATYQRQPVAAVIGAASSQVSVMVASMLQLFKIPMLSYSSTGVDLSEKPRFEYFSRVVPPDNLQAKAMAQLVAKLDWTYVHAVADTGSYGERGMDSFRAAATEMGICIDGDIHKISRRWTDDDFTILLIRMRHTNKARGVVMFVDEDNLRRFLTNLKRMIESGSHPELRGYFWFVASDSWGSKAAVIKSYEEIVAGAITIAPKMRFVNGFNEYFENLKPVNTFLSEYWQSMNCSNRINENFGKCFDSLSHRFKQEAYVPYVVDAVNVMARALHKYINTYCKGIEWKHCHLSKHGFEGKQLQKFYRNVSILPNQPPVIDANGDGMGQYSVFQLDNKGTYAPVGRLMAGSPLELNLDQIRDGLRATDGSTDLPVSVCSVPCDRGYYRAYQDQTCCWTCIPCDITTSIIVNETSCIQCPLGQVPNADLDFCRFIKPVHLEWTSAWALVPAVFSLCGIFSTLFVVSVFMKYNNTPVVMASGRELCYCMLLGIALCYFTTFFLVSQPSSLICSSQRIFIALSMSAVYAAILVKTNRLARVFKANSPVRPRCISPPAQVLICTTIVTVQIISILFSLYWDPPATDIEFPTRTEAVLICKNATWHLGLSLGYNFFLIFLCTVYAVKTRKIPENFNETRLIGFTMYSTLILWASFVPIYIATQNNFKIQITSLCMCISMSGTVALACFFAPKVYIVLFQPYKNVRTRHSAVGKLVNQQMRFISQLTAPPSHLPADYSTNCTAVSIMDVKSSTLALSEVSYPVARTIPPQVSAVPPAQASADSLATTMNHQLASAPAAPQESTTPLLEESALIAEEPKLEFPTMPTTQSSSNVGTTRERAQSLSAQRHSPPPAANCNNIHQRRSSSTASPSQKTSEHSEAIVLRRRNSAALAVASTAMAAAAVVVANRPSNKAATNPNLYSNCSMETVPDEDENEFDSASNDVENSESLLHSGPVQLILQEISADSFATFL